MSLLRTSLAVARRELTESLRDVMVLAFTFGFPLLFYPLLILGSLQLASLEDGLASRRPTRVVVEGPADLVEALAGDDDLQLVESPEARTADDLRADRIDQIVTAEEAGDALSITGLYTSTRPRSVQRRGAVEDVVDDLRDARQAALEAERDLPPGALDRWSIYSDDQAPPGRTLASLLGLLLPTMLLYTMGITGVYPVVEVVVGERERGTVETGMVTGAPRVALAIGKMLAVLSMMLLSVAGNALSLLFTFWSFLEQAAPDAEVAVAIAWPALLPALGLIAVTTVLMAAAMTVAVLPAESFRQAQSMASSVGVMLGLPALAGILPDLELTLPMALVPVTNATLVFRQALQEQTVDLAPTLLAVLVNGGLAVVLLVIAGRVIQSEAWLFGGKVPLWLRWMKFGSSS